MRAFQYLQPLACQHFFRRFGLVQQRAEFLPAAGIGT